MQFYKYNKLMGFIYIITFDVFLQKTVLLINERTNLINLTKS